MRKLKRLFKKHRPPVGSRPGSFVVREDAVIPKIRVINYTRDTVEEKDIEDVNELKEICNSDSVSWVDVQGMGDERILKKIAEIFSIHPLALADAVNVPTRPKLEDYEQNLLAVTCMVQIKNSPHTSLEQVSMCLGNNFVVTFQERYGDIFDPVRERVRKGKGPIRKSGADYLMYALIDTIIDGYYPALDALGDYLEELETELINSPTKATMERIYLVKRELLSLRRSIWPQREALNKLIKDESELVNKEVRPYLRDTYDHCAQVLDVLETFRELCGGFTDLYLSSISNRMNEVMKVLTIIGTIFIPLSFFAGVYGMNFEYIPELKMRWAYPVFWGFVVTIAGTMLYFFYKKGWIQFGSTNDENDE